jgi:hypothetical protein
VRVSVKRLAFAAGAAVLASLVAIASLLAVDLYLHKRTERSAGLNRWGYRGPVAGRKRPGEIRVAVLGGSTVFGYGVTWDQAFPALLEQRLNGRDRPPRFSVVNLGYNNEGAFSFRETLADYAYLGIDVVCLYEGYNDLMGDDGGSGPNHSVYRHDSPLFRATGYFPIFPLVFREKAMALMHGGDLNAAYASDGRTIFRPSVSTRAKAAALEAAAGIGDSLQRQLERVSTPTRSEAAALPGPGRCASPWGDYCESVAAAVEYALAHEQRVLAISQPRLPWPKVDERHRAQQQALAAMLRERFAGRPGFRHVDLTDAIDLRDPALGFDGMHLTAEGNARIAERLSAPVREIVR